MSEYDVPLEHAMRSVSWATGVKDDEVLASLVSELPQWAIQESVLKYEALAEAQTGKEPAAVAAEGLQINGQTLKGRLALVRSYLATCRSSGRGTLRWSERKDLMRNVTFVGNAPKRPVKFLDDWVKKLSVTAQVSGKAQHSQRLPSTRRLVRFHNRTRMNGGGRNYKCPWVREALYDWFVGMRYAIDWKRQRTLHSNGGGKKCAARFPRGLMYAKARSLMTDYVKAKVVSGEKPEAPVINAQWFVRWQQEYGLSMLQPNRRFKVPKAVCYERLELWWISVARVRALAEMTLGYDLDMENFDQSPFYRNESGAQNKATLAVAGENKVALIEGHCDTKARWTGNFTTWSNKDKKKKNKKNKQKNK